MGSITYLETLRDKVNQLNKQAWEIRVSDSIAAQQLSKEAIDIAESCNYTKGRAEGYRTLGFSYIRLSKHQEALVYLQKALALFEELNDLYGQSSIYEYFGIIERSLGNLSVSLEHLFKALELARHVKYTEGESLSLYHLGVTYKYLGHYEQALEHLLKSLSIARNFNLWIPESYSINLIGQIYFESGDHTRALDYYNQSLSLREKSGDKWGEAGCLDNIGFIYFKMKDYEKAVSFCSQGLKISEGVGDQKGQGNCLFHLGNIYENLRDYKKTVDYCKQGLQIRREIGDKKGEAEILLFLAELSLKENYYQKHALDPFDLLNAALKIGEEIKSLDLLSNIHLGFYRVSKHFNRHEEALHHLEKNMALEKEVHSAAIQQKILNLEIAHRVENSRKETEIYRLRNIELAGLYEESKKQKAEIEEQKKNVEETLAELKATQAQLIQSEKMASLGELTAGIAHEIQNPLNFVNNFSEVNTELIEEMKAELKAGHSEDAIAIANNIAENEQKINHHGKRADAIVKGMLQHSRSSTGVKEPTDINALADEYLRLAYYGLRAKDKSFNATMKTDYDENLEKFNIIPQDIGRVLLNLYNNAFYAASLPFKGGFSDSDKSYNPTVWVSTKKVGDRVLISVKDNGPGIPQKILDKIFQPFFTTKPTGQGTGLGLSLAYDIVKAQGGEIKVETKEGEGSTFILHLSID